MKVAFVVPYVPNLIRVRSYNLITQLSQQGIEITLFTLGSNEIDLRDANLMRTACKDVQYQNQPLWNSLLNCLGALPSSLPLQAVYSWNPALSGRLENILSNQNTSPHFDLVHVEHLRGSRYGARIKSRFSDVPLVWDSVDCISYLFKQASNQSRGAFGKIVSILELKRTQKAEGQLVCDFDHVLVTSSVDKNALLELAPVGDQPSPVSILSNGVDLKYYQPPHDIRKDSNTIVFSGKMSYHANIAMAAYLVREIMPRIWQKKRDICLKIVGKDPPREIKNLAANPLITVTGTVEDIRPYLWGATVAAVPLVYGAGIQNKILEAMASGTSVVTTSRTLSALHVAPGKDVLVADSPDEFAVKILQLIEDPKLRSEIGSRGLAYVRKYHDWKNIAGQLTNIYRQTIQEKRAQKAL